MVLTNKLRNMASAIARHVGGGVRRDTRRRAACGYAVVSPRAQARRHDVDS